MNEHCLIVITVYGPSLMSKSEDVWCRSWPTEFKYFRYFDVKFKNFSLKNISADKLTTKNQGGFFLFIIQAHFLMQTETWNVRKSLKKCYHTYRSDGRKTRRFFLFFYYFIYCAIHNSEEIFVASWCETFE